MKRIANLKTDHYVIWDTALDAPSTHIMTFEEMQTYIESWPKNNWDESSKIRQFLQLLENAKKWGVSTQLVHSDNPADQVQALIESNRAKDWAENYPWQAEEDDSEMTLEEIIKYWTLLPK